MTPELLLRRKRLMLAFAFGAISSLGFAPWDIWPLMLVGLAGLMWLTVQPATLRQALMTGWTFGFGHFLVGMYWLAQAFQYQSDLPVWSGWIAVVLLAVYLALYPAFVVMAARGFAASPTALVFAFSAFWMLSEWLRGIFFSGFPWNPVGAAALEMPGLAQMAAVIGAFGLSGLVCLFAGGLWLLISKSTQLRGIAVLGIVALAATGGFIAALGTSPVSSVRLNIVQANIGQDEKWSDDGVAHAIDTYMTLSPAPFAGPRLLIWPEAAIPDLLDEMPRARAMIATRLGRDDLLLLGALKAIRDEDGAAIAARNSLFVLDPNGDIVARYDKKHLVPFGEFLPMRTLLEAIGLARLAPGALDFWPGPGARTLPLAGHSPVGPLICYEVIFGGEVVDGADRPNWLLNISNDAWFAGAGAHMHLAQARLRAIEEGLPMARSTPTGISAVIDPRGRVTASLPRGAAGVLDARLPEPLGATIFARGGLWTSLLFCALLLGIAIGIYRSMIRG